MLQHCGQVSGAQSDSLLQLLQRNSNLVSRWADKALSQLHRLDVDRHDLDTIVGRQTRQHLFQRFQRIAFEDTRLTGRRVDIDHDVAGDGTLIGNLGAEAERKRGLSLRRIKRRQPGGFISKLV